MTPKQAIDVLLKVRDIQEPYPDTEEIDEAITIVTDALKEALDTLDNISFSL